MEFGCKDNKTGVNDDRNSWGHSYFNVRGKILGLLTDERWRKHVPKMFPLIVRANES